MSVLWDLLFLSQVLQVVSFSTFQNPLQTNICRSVGSPQDYQCSWVPVSDNIKINYCNPMGLEKQHTSSEFRRIGECIWNHGSLIEPNYYCGFSSLFAIVVFTVVITVVATVSVISCARYLRHSTASQFSNVQVKVNGIYFTLKIDPMKKIRDLEMIVCKEYNSMHHPKVSDTLAELQVEDMVIGPKRELLVNKDARLIDYIVSSIELSLSLREITERNKENQDSMCLTVVDDPTMDIRSVLHPPDKNVRNYPDIYADRIELHGISDYGTIPRTVVRFPSVSPRNFVDAVNSFKFIDKENDCLYFHILSTMESPLLSRRSRPALVSANQVNVPRLHQVASCTSRNRDRQLDVSDASQKVNEDANEFVEDAQYLNNNMFASESSGHDEVQDSVEADDNSVWRDCPASPDFN